MVDSSADRITLQFAMTMDDYARYVAVVERRQSDWTAYVVFVGTFFAAIPVALVSRSIGQHLSIAAADAELIGKSSLIAFLLGVMFMFLAGLIRSRLALRRHVEEIPNAFGPKTVVFDAMGVTATGQISEANWRWAAVKQLTTEKGLLLVWIGRAAVVVPDRSFASPDARNAGIAFIRARLSEASSAA
jgi:hypothetical protein